MVTIMPLNESYTEILKLDSILTTLEQPHALERMFDGWTIYIGNTDAIQHFGSYGSQMNLLETWGDGDVIGHLTAMEVIGIWKQQGVIKFTP